MGRASSLKATQSKLDSECRPRCYQGAALGCGGNVSPLTPSAERCREDCVSPSLRGVWCSFSCRLEFESIGKHPGGSFCFYPRGETVQNGRGHWRRADEFHGRSRTHSTRYCGPAGGGRCCVTVSGHSIGQPQPQAQPLLCLSAGRPRVFEFRLGGSGRPSAPVGRADPCTRLGPTVARAARWTPGRLTCHCKTWTLAAPHPQQACSPGGPSSLRAASFSPFGD